MATFSPDLEALVQGQHSDPFHLLGPHLDPGRALVLVRVMIPSAASVDLLMRYPLEIRVPMKRLHHHGLFEAEVPGLTSLDGGVDYRLAVRPDQGDTYVTDDPYRFGRIISDFDLHLFGEGTLLGAHERLGAHPTDLGGNAGVHFAVWAPTAQRVSVLGDFNSWDGRAHPMRKLVPSGIWELFIPGLGENERYKFEIRTGAGHLLHKSDPYGRYFEKSPLTASIVCRTEGYEWGDGEWMAARPAEGRWFNRPMSTYEVHLGSWQHVPEDGDRPLTYRELAERLVPYVKEQGFTHIELLPVLEHPFTGSWGYQVIGFFAPTSRYGHPHDFKYFIDACHRAGIGVLLDWVPGHFPKDAHGLAQFDGTALYEHADPRQGEQKDWGTLVFNYGRNEVRNFLLSSGLFWLQEYHLDGLRVDAVASMLYLDYSRSDGQWVPNKYGGRENLDAVEFLRHLNALTHSEVAGAITVAEESTSWPGVSRPVYLGGLGFTYKWDMGWMHDTLKFAERDPVYRRWAQGDITFAMLYAYSENFILPYSHDEVVYGKRSMLEKMPGDTWQKAATLRTLYAFLFAHPGKKLMFMGDEFGQWQEWNHDTSLHWDQEPHWPHSGIKAFVRALNHVYRSQPPMYERDYDPGGFQWIDCSDSENSVVSLVRRAADEVPPVVVVLNWTPVVRENYRVGAPWGGAWRVLLNSDAGEFGGSGAGTMGEVSAVFEARHGFPQSLSLTLPPLGALFLVPA
jgi:1,4-alpha-glucan branching enzyme